MKDVLVYIFNEMGQKQMAQSVLKSSSPFTIKIHCKILEDIFKKQDYLIPHDQAEQLKMYFELQRKSFFKT